MTATNPPLTAKEVKCFASEALKNGGVVYNDPHAKDRMGQRKISTVDVENVLNGGFVRDDPELSDNGRNWRYKIRSNRFFVVVEVWPGGRVFIVTVIRT